MEVSVVKLSFINVDIIPKYNATGVLNKVVGWEVKTKIY